jgi:hypothetical protein
VYTFEDINKVTFWIMPTLSYKKGGSTDGRLRLDGHLGLKYVDRYTTKWKRLYRETVTLEGPTTRFLPQQETSSPADRQKFLRVLPVFLDMLKDFHLSIVVVAPIEEFEEPKDMHWNLPVDGNRVTVYEVNGRGLVRDPVMVTQLLMNEVGGGADLARRQGTMPGVFTPWPAIHRGRGMRFMKSMPAPEE